jgi:hypothetical protein
MPRRRVAALLTGAVAVATLLVGAAAPAVSAAQGSAHTICVALVVDFDPLGGGVQSTCARIQQGKTGYDVLSAAGHTFSICSNGVLGSIDGKPADGCAQKNDEQHFWSYWHRRPGSSRWNYSTEGGGTYEPPAESTEGWRWTKSPPPDVAYSSICKTAPSPHASTPAPSGSAAGSVHSATPPAAHVSALPSTPAPEPTARTTRTSTTGHGPPAPRTSAPTSTPEAATATSAADLAGDDRGGGEDKGGGPPGALIAGIAVVVGLGGAAGWRARRSRGAG